MLSKSLIALAGTIALAVAGIATATPDASTSQIKAVLLHAPTQARPVTVDAPDGNQYTGTSFDTPMFDAATGQQIGRGSDIILSMDPDGAGFIAQTLTIFKFNDGSIFTRNTVAGQPTSVPLFEASHLVGALQAPGTSQIIGGTGAYAGATGSVRLSGMVDLTQLNATGDATFNCFFHLFLD